MYQVRDPQSKAGASTGGEVAPGHVPAVLALGSDAGPEGADVALPDIAAPGVPPYDMAWYRAPASAALMPYVLGYAECRVTVPVGETLRLRIHAHVEPIVSVLGAGDVFVELARGHRFRLPWLSIAGPQCRPTALVLSGAVQCFFVRFHSLGPRMLWGVRGTAYAGSPRLDAAAGPEQAPALRAWALAVSRAADFHARARLSEAFLGAQVPQASGRLGALLVALDALGAGAPATGTPATAARAAGVSGASLRRWFREEVGMCPRDVAAVRRFQRAMMRLQELPAGAGSTDHLQDLAASCGFPSVRALRCALRRYGDGLPRRGRDAQARLGMLRAAEVTVPPPPYLRWVSTP
ncbi:MAG: helix-turn-helix domain-containing protein [Rubricoccaceae bacterium]